MAFKRWTVSTTIYNIHAWNKDNKVICRWSSYYSNSGIRSKTKWFESLELNQDRSN